MSVALTIASKELHILGHRLPVAFDIDHRSASPGLEVVFVDSAKVHAEADETACYRYAAVQMGPGKEEHLAPRQREPHRFTGRRTLESAGCRRRDTLLPRLGQV